VFTPLKPRLARVEALPCCPRALQPLLRGGQQRAFGLIKSIARVRRPCHETRVNRRIKRIMLHQMQ